MGALRLPADVAPPNFFILGAAKCGTTTLYRLLSAQPSVFFPREKEPRFFEDDLYYARGIERFLLDHFRGAAGYPARGSATPSYLANGATVRDRMLRELGSDLRFIVILRDPIGRAWSHYLHQVRYRVEPETFERALELEQARKQEGKLHWVSYFEDGCYTRQLQCWHERFADDRFLVLLTRDLAEDPAAVVRRALSFLDISEEAALPPRRVVANPRGDARLGWIAASLNRPGRPMNGLKRLLPYRLRQRVRNRVNQWNRRTSDTLPQLDPRTAASLRERYRDDVLELEGLLGRDLSFWLRPPV